MGPINRKLSIRDEGNSSAAELSRQIQLLNDRIRKMKEEAAAEEAKHISECESWQGTTEELKLKFVKRVPVSLHVHCALPSSFACLSCLISLMCGEAEWCWFLKFRIGELEQRLQANEDRAVEDRQQAERLARLERESLEDKFRVQIRELQTQLAVLQQEKDHQLQELLSVTKKREEAEKSLKALQEESALSAQAGQLRVQELEKQLRSASGEHRKQAEEAAKRVKELQTQFSCFPHP